MHEPRLGVLRVVRAAGEAAAGREPDGDVHRQAHPVVGLAGDVDELVEAAADEVGELHLGDRPQALDGGADRAADDRRLGQRRVHHALGAELVDEAVGHLEGAAEGPDVLAHEEDALVGAHLLAHGVGDRLQIGHGRHGTSSGSRTRGRCRPRAGTAHRRTGRRGRCSGRASGTAAPRSTAASISALTLVADRLRVDAERLQALDLAVDRVLRAPLLDLLGRDVLHVVVRGVAVHAHGHGLDQRRALAGERALAGQARRPRTSPRGRCRRRSRPGTRRRRRARPG